MLQFSSRWARGLVVRALNFPPGALGYKHQPRKENSLSASNLEAQVVVSCLLSSDSSLGITQAKPCIA